MLNNAGYRFSHFHHEPTSIKTDAPPSVIWDIMRQFCIDNPPEGSKHKQQSLAAKSILSKDITTKIDFTYHSDNKFVLSQQGINDVLDNSNSLSYSLTHRNSLRNKIMDKKIAVAAGGNDCNDMSSRGSSSSRNRDKARFPMNPEKGWGPKRKPSVKVVTMMMIQELLVLVMVKQVMQIIHQKNVDVRMVTQVM